MSEDAWIKLGLELFQTLAIFLGGLIGLYEYRRFRRYGSKAELDLDFDIYPLDDEGINYMLDIRPKIKNRGNVRQIFPIIEIWVNTMSVYDVDAARPRSKGMKFRTRLFKCDNIIAESPDTYFFVDPGVAQIFPYQTVVEKPCQFLQVVVRFFYTVSFSKYLLLRFLIFTKLSKRWRDPNSNRVKRLKFFRVNEFHIMSKVKQLERSGYNELAG